MCCSRFRGWICSRSPTGSLRSGASLLPAFLAWIYATCWPLRHGADPECRHAAARLGVGCGSPRSTSSSSPVRYGSRQPSPSNAPMLRDKRCRFSASGDHDVRKTMPGALLSCRAHGCQPAASSLIRFGPGLTGLLLAPFGGLRPSSLWPPSRSRHLYGAGGGSRHGSPLSARRRVGGCFYLLTGCFRSGWRSPLIRRLSHRSVVTCVAGLALLGTAGQQPARSTAAG